MPVATIQEPEGFKKPHFSYGEATPGQITPQTEEVIEKIVAFMDCGK